MKKKNLKVTDQYEPKNRKERIEHLIQRGDLDIDVYAKSLNKRKDNLLRAFKNTKEINSLDYIMEAYFCMNGEVSLTWLITGGQPIKAPVKIFTYKRIDVRKRLNDLFNSEELSFKTLEETGGITRASIKKMLDEQAGDRKRKIANINVNHIIMIHLLTGCNFDYILDGIGPKYTWDKERDIVDFF
jgi:hypothetical protein